MKLEFQDYYAVLGVPRDAAPEAIRSAYRKLARKHHPDVDKTAGATERFQRINEAHEVLKDPKKRERYDRLGSRWKEGEEFAPPPDFDPAEFQSRGNGYGDFDGFSSFFETFFGEHGAPRPRGRRGRRARNVQLEVEISLEEVLTGATRTIERRVGTTKTSKRVQIPPGIVDGQPLQVSDGENGESLLLFVRVAPHPRFRVQDFDLVAELAVTPWEAALGARVPLRALDGSELQVTIQPGVPSGRVLRLRGQGLPRGDGFRGDLHARVQIVVPSTLSAEERRLFEELGRVSRFDPRR
ncbi:MAG: DnaJ domain-containing protein [Planctomycetes bacterium]|nr:DnaJ domain-containing protein [Planctomycetota bacterium]